MLTWTGPMNCNVNGHANGEQIMLPPETGSEWLKARTKTIQHN